MKAALIPSLAIALGLATVATAQAQSDEAEAADADDNPFFASAIPETFAARFVCHQRGREIFDFNEVRSFAPKQIMGVMTFSLITKDGVNHLIYLGQDTTCGLSVTPPSQ